MDGYKNKEVINNHAQLLAGKSTGLRLTQTTLGN